jgi:hypothetical protein
MPSYEISFLKRLLAAANGYPLSFVRQRVMIADVANSAAAVTIAKTQFQRSRDIPDWRECADWMEVTELPDPPDPPGSGRVATATARDDTARTAGPCRCPIILSFLPPGTSFEPSELAALGRAYDKAYARLHMENRPKPLKDALAAMILSLASLGNCDSDYLCDTTLNRVARGS